MFDERACNDTVVGTSCVVGCASGYTGTAEVFDCNVDGTLTGSLPLCQLSSEVYLEVRVVVTEKSVPASGRDAFVSRVASCAAALGVVPWTGSFPFNFGHEEVSAVGDTIIEGSHVITTVAAANNAGGLKDALLQCFPAGTFFPELNSTVAASDVLLVDSTTKVDPVSCVGKYLTYSPEGSISTIVHPLPGAAASPATACVRLACLGELRHTWTSILTPACGESCECPVRLHYAGPNMDALCGHVAARDKARTLPYGRDAVVEFVGEAGGSLRYECLFPHVPSWCAAIVVDAAADRNTHVEAGFPAIAFPRGDTCPHGASPGSVTECHRIRCAHGRVRMSFLKFNADLCANCSCSYIRTSDADGNLHTWTSAVGENPVQTLCGPTPPLPLLSAVGDVFVDFHSDDGSAQFELEWECLEEVSAAAVEANCTQAPPPSGAFEVVGDEDPSECFNVTCEGSRVRLVWHALQISGGGPECSSAYVAVRDSNGRETRMCSESAAYVTGSSSDVVVTVHAGGPTRLVRFDYTCEAHSVPAYVVGTEGGFDPSVPPVRQLLVASEAECRKAADTLGYRFASGHERDTARGTGCVLSAARKRVLFNVNPEGRHFTLGCFDNACVTRAVPPVTSRRVVSGYCEEHGLVTADEETCYCRAEEAGIRANRTLSSAAPRGCSVDPVMRLVSFSATGGECGSATCVCELPLWGGGTAIELEEFHPQRCALINAASLAEGSDRVAACTERCSRSPSCTHFYTLRDVRFTNTTLCFAMDCANSDLPRTASEAVPDRYDFFEGQPPTCADDPSGIVAGRGLACHALQGSCRSALSSADEYYLGDEMVSELCPVSCQRCGNATTKAFALARQEDVLLESGTCPASGMDYVATEAECEGQTVRFGERHGVPVYKLPFGTTGPQGCFWHLDLHSSSPSVRWSHSIPLYSVAGEPCTNTTVCLCALRAGRRFRRWRVRNLSPVVDKWVVSSLRFYSDEACMQPLNSIIHHGASDTPATPCADTVWPFANETEALGLRSCAELMAAGHCSTSIDTLVPGRSGVVEAHCACCRGGQYGPVIVSAWAEVPDVCPPHVRMAGIEYHRQPGYDCTLGHGKWTPGRPAASGVDYLGFEFQRDVDVRCVRLAQTRDPAEQSDVVLLERASAHEAAWEAAAVLSGGGAMWQRALAEPLRATAGTCHNQSRRTLSSLECRGWAAVARVGFASEPPPLMMVAGAPIGCFAVPDAGYYYNNGTLGAPETACTAAAACLCGSVGDFVGQGSCAGLAGEETYAKAVVGMVGKDVALSSQAASDMCLSMMGVSGALGAMPMLHAACILAMPAGVALNLSKVADAAPHLALRLLSQETSDGGRNTTPRFSAYSPLPLKCYVPHGAGAGHPPPYASGSLVGCNEPRGLGTCLAPSVVQPVNGVDFCRCTLGYSCAYYGAQCMTSTDIGVCGKPTMLSAHMLGRKAAVLQGGRSPVVQCGTRAVSGLCGPGTSPDERGVCACDLPKSTCLAGRCVALSGCGYAPTSAAGCATDMYVDAGGLCACAAGLHCSGSRCLALEVIRRQARVLQAAPGYCNGDSAGGCLSTNTFVQDGICGCIGGIASCMPDGMCVTAAPGSGLCNSVPREGPVPCEDAAAYVDLTTSYCACAGGSHMCNVETGKCTGACSSGCNEVLRSGCVCGPSSQREGVLCRCQPDMYCVAGVCAPAASLVPTFHPVVACEGLVGQYDGRCGEPAACQGHCVDFAYRSWEGVCLCIAGTSCQASGHCVQAVQETGLCDQKATTSEQPCLDSAGYPDSNNVCRCPEGTSCGVNSTRSDGLCHPYSGLGACDTPPRYDGSCLPHASRRGSMCVCDRGFECRSFQCIETAGNGWCNGEMTLQAHIVPATFLSAEQFNKLTPLGQCLDQFARAMSYRGAWGCFCEWGYTCSSLTGTCASSCSGPSVVLFPNPATQLCQCRPDYFCDEVTRKCVPETNLYTGCDVACDTCVCTPHSVNVRGACRCEPGYLCDFQYQVCVQGLGSVAGCDAASGSGGCSAHSYPDDQYTCRCGSGYLCAFGASGLGRCRVLAVDVCAAVRSQAVSGDCSCDATSAMGHWDGASCSTCAPGFFGDDCRSSCELAALPDYLWGELGAGNQHCTCPQTNGTGLFGFEGILCNECRPEKGKFGVNCTQEEPLTTNMYSFEFEAFDEGTVGPLFVLAYSEFAVKVSMGEGMVLGDLGYVELRMMPAFRDASVVRDTSTASNLLATQADSLVLCHMLPTWDPTSDVGHCYIVAPRGTTNYAFLYIRNGPAPKTTSVVPQGVSGCCNGHGFCGTSQADCACASNPDMGYWEEAFECARCKTGYHGRFCKEFRGVFLEVNTAEPPSPLPQPFLGQSLFYGVGVTQETPYAVRLHGTGDCDLAVSMLSSCPDGWTENSGYCYFIDADACGTITEAGAACGEEGAVPLDLSGDEAELHFVRALMENAALAATETCPHGDKVWVDLQQTREADCSLKTDEAACTAEPHCGWDGSACAVDEAQACYTNAGRGQSDCETIGETVVIDGRTRSKRCFWNRFNAPIDEAAHAVPPEHLRREAHRYPLRGAQRGMCEPQYKMRYGSDATGERAVRASVMEGLLLKHTLSPPECAGNREVNAADAARPPTCFRPACTNVGCVCPSPPAPPCSATCDGVTRANGYLPQFEEETGPFRQAGECPQSEGAHFGCRREVAGPGECYAHMTCPGSSPNCYDGVGCEKCRFAAWGMGGDAFGDQSRQSAWDPAGSDVLRLCTVLAMDSTKTSGPKLRGLPAFCNDIFAEQQYANKAARSSLDYGSIAKARYVCKKKIALETSELGGTQKRTLTPIAGDESLFVKPDCYRPEVFDATDDVCSGRVPRGKSHMALRVTCLQRGSSYNLSGSYVGKGHFRIGNSGPCTDSDEGGHWTGEFCNECQIRWRGSSCDKFQSCTTDGLSCGNGACDLQSGFCNCDANYYGTHCEEYCDATTCVQGTCNTEFGKRCEPTTNCATLCLCSTHVEGARCDQCEFGFFGSDCTRDCVCSKTSSVGCDRNTGACTCYQNSARGHFFGDACDECMPGYYGLSCSTRCNAATTCDGHGTCTTSGVCLCDADYYGTDCATYCTPDVCSLHGTCDTSSGACLCTADYVEGYWTGAACDACKEGYWGGSCKQDCQCSMNGVCDARSGSCACYASRELGYWRGTECASCIEGWRGQTCNEPAKQVANKLSAVGNLIVNAEDRSSKLYEHLKGDILFVNSTEGQCGSGDSVHLYAMAGADVSLWQRACAAAWSSWEYVSTCNLYSGLGFGSEIVRTVPLHDRIFVAVRGATQSAVVWFHARDSVSEASPSLQCSASGTGSLAERNVQNFVSETQADGGAMGQHVVDMAVDPYHEALFLLVTAYDTATPAVQTHYVTKLPLNVTDWRGGGSQHLQTRLELHAFDTVDALRFVGDDKYSPYIIVMGTSKARVVLSKVFVPTTFVDEDTRVRTPDDGPAMETLRSVFTFTPGMCLEVPCERVTQHHAVDGWLFLAVQTYYKSTLTRGAALGRVNLRFIKRTSEYGVRVVESEAWTRDEMGVGFMAFDYPSLGAPSPTSHILTDRSEYIYLGMRNATPSVIRQFHAADFAPEQASLLLNYENVVTSYQSAVAAVVDREARLLYVALKLPRLQVLQINLYEVMHVGPNLVDGTGGTIVLVRGRGFPNLAPFCRFGDSVVSGANSATFLSDTAVQCKAPRVPNYDACKDVPLDVSFGAADRFTDNGVMIRHISLPLVFDLRPQRGTLIPTEPITLHGTGFLESAFLACKVADTVTRGTFLSTMSVLCEQPVLTEPRITTAEVSMDGQKFSQSSVPYYIIGQPAALGYTVKTCFEPTGCPDFVPATALDLYSEVSDAVTRLKNVTVRFYDNAGNYVGLRDDLVRGGNVTLELVQHAAAPKGPQYEALYGTLSKPIEAGQVTFDDLHFLYPGSGDYAVDICLDAAILDTDTEARRNATAAIAPIRFPFRITAVATRLLFATPPPRYSSNKERLTTQPVVVFSDVSENVVTSAAGVLSSRLLLTHAQSKPVSVVLDTPPCTWPDCRLSVAVDAAGVTLPFPQLEGNLPSDYELKEGVATYKTLRILEGNEGYNYTLRVSAAGIASPIESAPIAIAECHSTNNDPVYELRPDNGQLGATVVTVKGWGFREDEQAAMHCKYGADQPTKARFIDTCTMLCNLPAKKGPRTDPLEIAYTADMHANGIVTSLGFNYTYIDVVDSVRARMDGRSAYPAESLLLLDPIVVTLHDSAGNFLRTWDTLSRRVYIRTRLPVVTTPLFLDISDATVTFSQLTVKLPEIGPYTVTVSTDPAEPLPALASSIDALPSTEPGVNGTTQPPAAGEPAVLDDPCLHPLNCTQKTECDGPPDGSTCDGNCGCGAEAACVASPRGCVWLNGQCRRVQPCTASSYVCLFGSGDDEVASLTESADLLNSTAHCRLDDARLVQGSDCVHLNSTLETGLEACLATAAVMRDGDWVNFETSSTRCVVFGGACATSFTSHGWVASRLDCDGASPTVTLGARGGENGTEDSVEPGNLSLSLSQTYTAVADDTSTQTGLGADISVADPDTCVAMGGMTCPLTHPPRPASFVVRTSFVVQIISGIPKELKFHTTGDVDPRTGLPVDHYSLFSTSKTKLRVQPVVRVADVSGNTVTVFEAQPLISVSVVPYCRKGTQQTYQHFDYETQATHLLGGCQPGFVFQQSDLSGGPTVYGASLGPFCHGTKPSSMPASTWEEQCTRVKGDSAPVLNGLATFREIFFRGDRDVKYKMYFAISHPLLPELVSELIRIPDCSCTTALCGTAPSWALLTGGVSITLIGWDFNPSRLLKVNVAGQKLNVDYLDTCTAVAHIPAVAPARAAAVQALSREAWALQSTTGSFGLQLLDESNVDFTSTPLPFQMKQPVPLQLGLVGGCVTESGCWLANSSIPDSSVACPADATDTAATPKRCYLTDTLVHVGQVHIALQDAGGGDLIMGQGFDPLVATEVEVTLTILPPKQETRQVERVGDVLKQRQCDAIRGANCTGSVLNATKTAWTEYGLLSVQDISIELPVTGTYTLNFSTTAVNSKNQPIRWGLLRLVVGVNIPHSFSFTEVPVNETDGSIMIPAPTLAVKDIAGNPLSDADLPVPIDVEVHIVPYELVQLPSRPRLLVADIPSDARWQAKVYQEPDSFDQIIGTGVPTVGGGEPDTLLGGVATCVASGGAVCTYPLLSFLPADLGGSPNYAKMQLYRKRPQDVDPPYYTAGNSMLSSAQRSVPIAAAKADFKGLAVSDVWHGVVYTMTYRIAQRFYDFLPPVSHGLTRTECLPVDGVPYFGLNFSTHCLKCPTGAVCDGSVFLKAEVGYWRAQATDIAFYACEGTNCDRADRRLAGDDLCIDGTMGPVCAVCRPGWGKNGVGCAKCPSSMQSLAVVALFVGAMLAVVVLMVKANLAGGGKQKSRLSIIFKILMNYLQTATLMREFQGKVKAMAASVLDTQEKASGPGTNFGGFSCLTGADQYDVFQMWMVIPIVVLVVPGFITGVVTLQKRLWSKGAVEKLTHKRARRHSFGLEADTEDHQLAQIYAMQSGKPIPEFAGDAKAGAAATSSTATESAPTETAEEESWPDDDAYVTEANLAEGRAMQAGWGRHPEVVSAEQGRKARHFADVKAMEYEAENLARAEAARALAVAQRGDSEGLRELREDVAVISAGTTAALAEYEARRVAHLEERPPPAKWVEKISKRYGKRYWQHCETGESTWCKPQEVADAERWHDARHTLDADIERVRCRSAPLPEAEQAPSPPADACGRPPRPRGQAAPQAGSATLPQPCQAEDALGSSSSSSSSRGMPVPLPTQEEDERCQSANTSPADEKEPALDDGSLLFSLPESPLRSEVQGQPIKGNAQGFNPGEYVEVRFGGSDVWEQGIVTGVALDLDGTWAVHVSVAGGAPAMPSEIRDSCEYPLREPADVAARKAILGTDSYYVIEAMKAVGLAEWKGTLTWRQRAAKVRQFKSAVQQEEAERAACLKALQEEVISADAASDATVFEIRRLEEEQAALEVERCFRRILPRKRWGMLSRELHNTLALKLDGRLKGEAEAKRDIASAQKVLQGDAQMHVWPGTAELRNTKDGSMLFIDSFRMKATIMYVNVLAEANGKATLPSLSSMQLLLKGCFPVEPSAVDIVEDGPYLREGTLTFDLPRRLVLKEKVKLVYAANKEWTAYKGTVEDEHSGGPRPNEGIYMCTVCNADVAIVACDLCGEEREPDLPWEERTPPFFHPSGTREMAQTRAEQVSSKDKKKLMCPLSGELMCELCHSIVHCTQDGFGARYAHLTGRHGGGHPSMLGTKVLRKTTIKVDEPSYDVTTEAGALRLEHERGKKPEEIYIVTVLVVIFLVYPRLMTEVSALMKCNDIADLDESFLAADYRISCKSSTYKKWRMIARLLFVFYGFGIPCAGVIVCVNPSPHLTSSHIASQLLYVYGGKDGGRGLLKKSTNAMLGFLYSGYRFDRYVGGAALPFTRVAQVLLGDGRHVPQDACRLHLSLLQRRRRRIQTHVRSVADGGLPHAEHLPQAVYVQQPVVAREPVALQRGALAQPQHAVQRGVPAAGGGGDHRHPPHSLHQSVHAADLCVRHGVRRRPGGGVRHV